MLRVAVVEDDERCAEQMRQYLEEYQRETGQAVEVTVYADGEDLLEQYKPVFDVIFLDIQMPFVDGMTAAKYIRRQDPAVAIIFVTNLAQYAIQGYEVNALDYMLKPLNYFSFSQRLSRAVSNLKRREDDYIVVAVRGGAVRLDVGNILYVERQGHHLLIHTLGDTVTSQATIQQMEQALEGRRFFRCNKGCLVNLSAVDGVQDACAMVHGENIPISRNRRQEFLTALSQHWGR